MTENQGLEILELEKLLSKEVECQMDHSSPGDCLKRATHLAKDCRQSWTVCLRAVRAIQYMLDRDSTCKYCKRPASECWVIRQL